jgi:hypothetical protein
MSGRTTTLTEPRSRAARPAVSVDELKRAWYAVQAGDFRRTPRPARATLPATHTPAADEWSPATGERVVPVVGAAGNVGASTVALALATASTRQARVVECCPPAASGLAAASTAELGVTPAGGGGWRQGRRDHILIERTTGPHTPFDDLPSPTPAEHAEQLTILDAGDATHLAGATGWLPAVVHAVRFVIVVTTATIPGFRRLEAALEMLGLDPTRVAVAVVGPVRRKWPRGLEHSAGPAVRRLLNESRVVEVPHDRTLAVTGVDSRRLPGSVVAAAAALLTLTGSDTHLTT